MPNHIWTQSNKNSFKNGKLSICHHLQTHLKQKKNYLISKNYSLSINNDLAKSRFAPFCSTGEDFSSPAIRNKFGHFHPHLRPAREAHQPVDGLFASPSINDCNRIGYSLLTTIDQRKYPDFIIFYPDF